MEKTIITTGKTIDLAIEAALTQLGLSRDDVSVQVLCQAKPGFLGIGATPARVEVTYEAPDLKPEAPKTALSSASRSKPKAAPVKKPEAPKPEAPKAEPKPEAPKAAVPAPKAEEPKKQPKPRQEKPIKNFKLHTVYDISVLIRKFRPSHEGNPFGHTVYKRPTEHFSQIFPTLLRKFKNFLCVFFPFFRRFLLLFMDQSLKSVNITLSRFVGFFYVLTIIHFFSPISIP